MRVGTINSTFLLNFIILLVLSNGNLTGLENVDFHFDSITTEDGLSNGIIYSIIQDDTGFMWFGTQDGGINRYDGNNFKIFWHDSSNENSVASNNAGQLFQDSRGLIWIGTWGKGLDCFNPKTGEFKHYIHSVSDPQSISDNRIQDIFEDNDGYLWLATFQGGFCRLDVDTGVFTRYQNEEDRNSFIDTRARTITQDGDGNMWISSNKGVSRLNTETGVFKHFTHDRGDNNSISDNTVYKVYFSPGGELWLGTGKGLHRFNPEDESFEHWIHDPKDRDSIPKGEISTLFEDRDGRLWIGTYYNGLILYDRSNNIFHQFTEEHNQIGSLAGNDIRTIYEDRSGVIWVGTKGGGISKFDTKSIKFRVLKYDVSNDSGLSDSKIYAITSDGHGKILLGSNSGLNVWNPDTNIVELHHKQSNFSSGHIRSLLVDNKGLLWVGTDNGGINRYDPVSDETRIYRHSANNKNSLSDDYIISIYEDKRGDIWIGTYRNGINRYLPENDSFIHYKNETGNVKSLSHNEVSCIYEDSDGIFWVGTAEGLNLMDRDKGSFERVLSSYWIYAIYEDDGGYLWLATKGSGLIRYDRETNTYSDFTIEDGLPSNVINGILPDNSGLWLSTNNGISHFDKIGEFRNFGVDDGLQHKEFNPRSYFRDSKGFLYFGGLKGVNYFSPESIFENDYPVEVVITDIKVMGSSVADNSLVPYKTELSLSYNDIFFTIDYSGLDFTNPEEIMYAYKLEGFDKKWHYAGSNSNTSYTNLDGGNYTFKVKAANNDEVWSESVRELDIYISTPPWKRWWAISLYGLIFSYIIVMIVRYRTRKFTLKINEQNRINELLEKKVKQRTKELMSANEELKRLSNIDGLTRIYNRRYLDDYLEKEWNRQLRNRKPISIIMCDIDFFKPYNDYYGHIQGDQCLIKVANALKGSIQRTTDVLARYGGEEFCFILPNTDNKGAVTVAENARVNIEKLKLEHRKSLTYDFVSISLGVATIIPSPDMTIESSIKLADKALYKSKEGGRNRVSFEDC